MKKRAKKQPMDEKNLKKFSLSIYIEKKKR